MEEGRGLPKHNSNQPLLWPDRGNGAGSLWLQREPRTGIFRADKPQFGTVRREVVARPEETRIVRSDGEDRQQPVSPGNLPLID